MCTWAYDFCLPFQSHNFLSQHALVMKLSSQHFVQSYLALWRRLQNENILFQFWDITFSETWYMVCAHAHACPASFHRSSHIFNIIIVLCVCACIFSLQLCNFVPFSLLHFVDFSLQISLNVHFNLLDIILLFNYILDPFINTFIIVLKSRTCIVLAEKLTIAAQTSTHMLPSTQVPDPCVYYWLPL